MRLSRDTLGRFLPRRRRNPGPKGRAKRIEIASALARRARVYGRRGRAMTGSPIHREVAGYYPHATALSDAYLRRRKASGFPEKNPRRRLNPIGLAGLSSVNPKRGASTMARRRAKRRRTAAQRAAFRKMIAGLRRSRGSSPKRRRRRTNPTKGVTMARRKNRRRSRRAAVVMINPRRKNRRWGAVAAHKRRVNPRVRRRRRTNPSGAGIKGAVRSVFMVAVPALVAGGLANFIDAKLADKHILLRIGAKVAQAAGAAMLFRSRPVIAYAAMGAAIGSIGGEFGTRMGGGVIVGGTTVAKAQGVAALVTEDRNTMAVLVEGMGRMGYQIDNNVSLGDNAALPAGSYQDVNLG